MSWILGLFSDNELGKGGCIVVLTLQNRKLCLDGQVCGMAEHMINYIINSCIGLIYGLWSIFSPVTHGIIRSISCIYCCVLCILLLPIYTCIGLLTTHGAWWPILCICPCIGLLEILVEKHLFMHYNSFILSYAFLKHTWYKEVKISQFPQTLIVGTL